MAEATASRDPRRHTLSVVFVGSADRRRATVVLTVPVLAGGTFRGVLSALVDLQGFWDSVADRYRNDGYVLSMIDGRGRLLASNDTDGAPVGTVMGERLFYLPSAGLCLLAGRAWERAAAPLIRFCQDPWRAGDRARTADG